MKRREKNETGDPPSTGRSSALLAEINGEHSDNTLSVLGDRSATEVMVPRTEMAYMPKDETVKECISLFRETKFTRYPVIDGDKDRVIGFVNFKEVIAEYVADPAVGTKSIKHFIRPVIRVIDSIPVHELLAKMQAERMQMAILINEYGGTAGLVTAKDIVEVIVGRLHDEFDIASPPVIQIVGNHHYIASSKLSVSETAQLLGIDMNDDDVDTIGGWILTENFDIQCGQTIEYSGFLFTVLEMDDHQIRQLEIKPVTAVKRIESSMDPSAISIPAPNNA